MTAPLGRTRGWLLSALLAMCFASLMPTAATALPAPPVVADDAQAVEAAQAKPYLRVREVQGEFSELQVAVRSFRNPEDESQPEIVLVGVAHIGDQKLYDELQDVLDRYDVVLYEAVKPAGTGTLPLTNDAARTEVTEARLRMLGSVIATYKAQHEAYPESLAALRDADLGDHRMENWLDIITKDGWGRGFAYRLTETGFVVTSPAATEQEAGPAKELSTTAEENHRPLSSGSSDGIQAQLAKALGLAFQLDAMDYTRSHWRPSDMSMDEVNRAMSERGGSFGVMEDTLAGAGLTGRMAGVLLNLIAVLDSMMGGGVADLMKVMMIELLGDSDLAVRALEQQMGNAFVDVIINERNIVVMNDLRAIIESEPDVRSVGVFYGAGHMPDFERRLAEMGYHPADVEWLPVIHVNIAESAMSARQLQQMRMMMRQSIRQQLGRGR